MTEERQSSTVGSEAVVEADVTLRPRQKPIDRGSWPWVVTAGGAALALGVSFLAVIWFMKRPLALFFISLTIAAAMTPVVRWIEQRLPRTLAVVAAYLMLALLVILIGAIVFPPLVDQAGEMAERVPDLADRVERWLQRRLPIDDAAILDRVFGQVANLVSTLVALPLRVSSSLFDLLVVVFLSIYVLIAAPEMHKTVLSLVPDENEERVDYVLGRLVHNMGGYVRGVSITAAIIGSISYVGLLIIGVNFPLALAIVSGLSEFVPFIGPWIAGAVMVMVALLQSPTKALIVAIFALALQQVEGNLVHPNVMRPQTCVSPLTTIFAIFAGAAVAGLLGALIAVPLAAAIRVLVVELLIPAVRRQTGAVAEETDYAC